MIAELLQHSVHRHCTGQLQKHFKVREGLSLPGEKMSTKEGCIVW